MKSKNADFLRQGIVDLCRKMTHEQRLRAFINHSHLMKKLSAMGELKRNETLPKIWR